MYIAIATYVLNFRKCQYIQIEQSIILLEQYTIPYTDLSNISSQLCDLITFLGTQRYTQLCIQLYYIYIYVQNYCKVPFFEGCKFREYTKKEVQGSSRKQFSQISLLMLMQSGHYCFQYKHPMERQCLTNCETVVLTITIYNTC